jgi:hypothetical protein
MGESSQNEILIFIEEKSDKWWCTLKKKVERGVKNV